MSGRTPDEGRYSKVSRRMWDDEGFCELSAAPPNAQTLWQRLLTGPELGCIPGLYTARLGGLADALNWTKEEVYEKWLEIEQQEMAVADWRAGLVWVPNSIVHNAPNSPNTILGWRLALRELPECNLKRMAIKELRARCAELGEAWSAAFELAIGEPKLAQKKKVKTSLVPSKTAIRGPSETPPDTASHEPRETPSETASYSQEQEQEQDTGYRTQEQEGEKARGAPPPPLPVPPKPISSSRRQALAFCMADPDDVAVLEAWRDRFQKTDVVFTADRSVPIAERRARGMTQQDALDAVAGAERDDWFLGKGSPLSLIFNKQERFEQYRDAGRAIREGRPLPRAARSSARGAPPPRQPDSGYRPSEHAQELK